MNEDTQKQSMDIFMEEIRKLHENGHTSNAIFISSTLDDILQRIIESRLPNLGAKLKEKLFEGYGPFATSASKIDVAYAMGIIEKNLSDELHTIRAIRNKFAHPTPQKPASFNDDNMEKLFHKFADFTPGSHRQTFFVSKFKSILQQLQPQLNHAYIIAELKKTTSG